ncbi:MAG: PilZ domain-containing protein [Desulfobulbaceae bacterium]|nr:PilZ domain-containing protein [Desulfobulbaceae bacterium]
MSDKEKTAWDRISSIDLEIDEGNSEAMKPHCDRKYPRTDLVSLNKVLDENLSYLPVKMVTTTSGQCKGMILDISEDGCRIAVPVQLKEGELAKVGFIVKKRTIISTAVVRWVLPQKNFDFDLVGMKFQGMPDDAKEFLRAISAVAMLDIVEIEKMKQVL